MSNRKILFKLAEIPETYKNVRWLLLSVVQFGEKRSNRKILFKLIEEVMVNLAPEIFYTQRAVSLFYQDSKPCGGTARRAGQAC
jgi:hypothetical protein